MSCEEIEHAIAMAKQIREIFIKERPRDLAASMALWMANARVYEESGWTFEQFMEDAGFAYYDYSSKNRSDP